MTFRIITPYEITAAEIVATNIPLEPEWDHGDVYSRGAPGSIVLASDGQIYEFIGDSGAAYAHANPVLPDQPDWVLLGPPNRLRPFDIQRGVDQARVIETHAEWPEEITYTVAAPGRVMGLCFENVEGSSIEAIATDISPGDNLDIEYQLQDLANIQESFWRYFNLPFVPEREYRRTDLNVAPSVPIDIAISHPGGTARVGAIVMGLVQEVGATLVKPSWEIDSFSIKESDGRKTTLIRLLPGEMVSCEVKVPAGGQRAVKEVLRALDGLAAVWELSDGNPEYTVYGVLESAVMTARTSRHSYLNLRIVGL
ncbi:hypothetical protein [Pseudoroseicyclus sp. CXY001]|uniref:hypothetical protein n=1 Tax=Pseudoroseicyclus sp. CXY001 TaxID=3242492 RepID=UPI003570BA28